MKKGQSQTRWPFLNQTLKISLFDFAFFELDVLTYNRIVLTHHHFFGDVTWVLLRDVEEAGACSRVQADLDCCWLRHGADLGLNSKRA